jgi:hypothetical protein
VIVGLLRIVNDSRVLHRFVCIKMLNTMVCLGMVEILIITNFQYHKISIESMQK